MSNFRNEIAATFVEKLKESPDITPEMVATLRKLLSATRKLKADDLVKVFSPPAGGDVK